MTTKKSLNQTNPLTTLTHLKSAPLYLNNQVNESTHILITINKTKLKSFIVYGLAIISSTYTLYKCYKHYENVMLTLNNVRNSVCESRCVREESMYEYWD